MGRYTTQVVSFNDNTSVAAYSSVRTCTITPGGYTGTCVLQLSGGIGGCATTGNTGNGNCCAWTVPNGVTNIVIEIWGGGGSGAAHNCTCCGLATGGGGGAYSKTSTLKVNPGDVYTLCAGAGATGPTGGSTSSVCCCGAKGVTTYVTGTGLTNFCAEGGYGGESRCVPVGHSVQSPNGGFPGTGGILNLRGYDGGRFTGFDGSQPWCQGASYGGGSPFGGRNMYINFDFCSQYNDNRGTLKDGGICGFTGSFPGGGGTGSWPSCCCGINGRGGDGAAGLIRIWM